MRSSIFALTALAAIIGGASIASAAPNQSAQASDNPLTTRSPATNDDSSPDVTGTINNGSPQSGENTGSGIGAGANDGLGRNPQGTTGVRGGAQGAASPYGQE